MEAMKTMKGKDVGSVMGGRFVAGATGWGGCVSLAGMKCRVCGVGAGVGVTHRNGCLFIQPLVTIPGFFLLLHPPPH